MLNFAASPQISPKNRDSEASHLWRGLPTPLHLTGDQLTEISRTFDLPTDGADRMTASG